MRWNRRGRAGGIGAGGSGTEEGGGLRGAHRLSLERLIRIF